MIAAALGAYLLLGGLISFERPDRFECCSSAWAESLDLSAELCRMHFAKYVPILNRTPAIQTVVHVLKACHNGRRDTVGGFYLGEGIILVTAKNHYDWRIGYVISGVANSLWGCWRYGTTELGEHSCGDAVSGRSPLIDDGYFNSPFFAVIKDKQLSAFHCTVTKVSGVYTVNEDKCAFQCRDYVGGLFCGVRRDCRNSERLSSIAALFDATVPRDNQDAERRERKESGTNREPERVAGESPIYFFAFLLGGCLGTIFCTLLA
jgi:hypothetical protein